MQSKIMCESSYLKLTSIDLSCSNMGLNYITVDTVCRAVEIDKMLDALMIRCFLLGQ